MVIFFSCLLAFPGGGIFLMTIVAKSMFRINLAKWKVRRIFSLFFVCLFSCAPESELGFPGLAGCGPTLRQDGSGMAYLKSSPYTVNGLTLPMPMDGLHSSMGYPSGESLIHIYKFIFF